MSDPYFELLEIIKAQDQLDRIGKRLALAAERLAKRLNVEIKSKTVTLSPSDNPFEAFSAHDICRVCKDPDCLGDYTHYE